MQILKIRLEHYLPQYILFSNKVFNLVLQKPSLSIFHEVLLQTGFKRFTFSSFSCIFYSQIRNIVMNKFIIISMKERQADGSIQFNSIPSRKNSKISLPDSYMNRTPILTTDPFLQKIDIFVRAFQNVCHKLETTIQIQNRKILSMENILMNTLIGRFDKLIQINQKMNDGINKKQDGSCEKQYLQNKNLFDTTSLKQPQRQKGGSLKQSIMVINKASSENDTLLTAPIFPPLPSMDNIINGITPMRRKNNSFDDSDSANKIKVLAPEMANRSSTKVIQKMVVAFCNPLTSDNEQAQINKWIGSFFHYTAATYFQLYSKGNISYEDMKIKFSYDIISETLMLSTKWNDFCKLRDIDSKQKIITRRPQFYHMVNFASKKCLQFLINKYPPSRRKKVDTELTQRIKDTNKEFSIPKFDMLSNGKMDIGLDDKQTDFTKQIKIWLNKLVTQTKKQFPTFKDKMRRIFVNTDESVEGEKVTGMESELQFVIGTKISEGTLLFSQQQIDAPGLQLQSTELLRILMKWCQQLLSYFVKQEQKIYGNTSGFKTTKGSLPIKIPKSRLDLLAANLKNIYQSQVQPALNIQNNNIGQLVTDLLSMASDGINGNQFLDQREISIVKLSDYLNQSLKAHVLNFLNLIISKLIQLRGRYTDQKLQYNINLVTFGVMDLLRCRCVGSKAEIYRIYRQIFKNKDYFEIIRVKNKLNQPTRDIIINLKIKKSFLICEVQLSLGEAEDEVHDHFCHFLYQLQRTNFGVLFECASQICNLDPRIFYLQHNKNITFKGPTSRKFQFIQSLQMNQDGLSCQCNHQITPMKYWSSERPFCCALCNKFRPGFDLCLPYLQCSVCSASVCPECIIMITKNNTEFIEKYTSNNSNFQNLIRFFYPKHIFEGVGSSDQAEQKIPSLLQKYPYILHMIVDNIGHKPTIYKRFQNRFIQAFSTLGNVSMPSKAAFCWNYMIALKPSQRKTLNEIKNLRKYSVGIEWHNLQQILKEKNINQVIAVIDQPSKSALIVDIIESEEQIQSCLTKRRVQKTISQTNRLQSTVLELTSKNLGDISLLGAVQKKQNIKILNLWENKIKNIALLSQFHRMKELFLRQNQVESIQPVVAMSQLEVLLVCNNKISGPLPILNLPSLTALDISLNEFTSISNLSMSNCKNLVFLRMVNTKITEIPIMNLPKLEVFWFDHNDISSIDNLAKSLIPELAKVSGTHTNITGNLPELHFPKLESLILNYNQITSIQNLEKSQFGGLKILALHHNNISGAIPNLNSPSLIKLDLSYNKISSFSPGLFTNSRFSSLQSLDLKFNHIGGEFPKMELKSLRKLDMSNNLISSISSLGACQFPSLQFLDLSKNQIKGSLPILRFLKIRRLFFSNNEINDAKNLSQSKMPSLSIMKLDGNKIASVVPRIYFQNLKYLDLSSNFITSQQFLQYIHLLPSLQKVYLANNPPDLKTSIMYNSSIALQKLLSFTDTYQD